MTTIARVPRLFIPFYVVAITLLAAVALIAPGRTYTTIYAHDLFVHLDGAWRVVAGQLPNRDFHTPLGLVAYVLPALGLKLGGSLGLALPLAMVFFAGLVAPLTIWVCWSRLPTVLAVLFSTLLVVLAVAPMNVGDTPRFLTFGMYYNRWCWVAIMLLFVTFVPRRVGGRWSVAADALTIGALLAIMFHLKITYFVLGLGYVVAMVVVARTRRAAVLGLLVAAAVLGVMAVALRTVPAYVGDIRNAAAVSGVVRDGLYALASTGVANGHAIVVLALVAVVAGFRGIGWSDALAAVYILLSSLLLANQNLQGPELPALVAAALVLHLAPQVRRSARDNDAHRLGVVAVAIVALAYGPLVLGLTSLLLHARKAAAPGATPVLDGVAFADPSTPNVPLATQRQLARAYGGGSVAVTDLAPFRVEPTGPGEYYATLQDGMALLGSTPALAGRVATFDSANPFNVLLRRQPPRHDNSWNHLGRTFSADVHLAAEQQLGDVDVVMIPKDPTITEGAAVLRQIFAPYLEQHFRLAGESSFWLAYARRDPRA